MRTRAVKYRGVEYPKIADLSEAIKVSRFDIRKAANRKQKINGYRVYYVEKREYKFNNNSLNNKGKIPVIYQGNKYTSQCKLAKKLGIHSCRVSEALRTGKEIATIGGFVDEPF